MSKNKNQYWKLRKKHGRNKKFKNPETLWNACTEYFEATDQRKWNKTVFIKATNSMATVPKDVPFTLSGLCVFLNIGRSTWSDYKNKKGYEHFSDIITRVHDIIRTHQFEGAAVGVFNANIIARTLGMPDKKDIASKPPLQPIFTK